MADVDEQIEQPQVDDNQVPDNDGGQQPTPPSKKLYDQLYKTQLYTNSYDDFQKKYNTPQQIDNLYKGLNDSQLYTKSKDDFYNQYFTSNKTAPVPEHQIVHTDLQNLRFLNDQSGNTPQRSFNAGEGGVVPNPDYDQQVTAQQQSQASLDKGYADLGTKWGTDKDATKKVINDFPYENNEDNLKQHAQFLKDNPVAYERYRAADENLHLLAKDDPTNHTANEYNELQGDPSKPVWNLEQLQQNIELQKNIINGTNLSNAEKQKALNNLQINRSSSFNLLNPDIQNGATSDANLKGSLDATQYAGLMTLKSFDPQKYQLYSKLLEPRDDEKDDTVEMKLGKEKIQQELLNIGRNNTANYVNEHQYDLDKQYKSLQLNPDDQKKYDAASRSINNLQPQIDAIKNNQNRTQPDIDNYNKLINQYNSNVDVIKGLPQNNDKLSGIAQQYLYNRGILQGLNQDVQRDGSRFPYSKELEFERQAKELSGDEDKGILNYTLSKFGRGVGKGIKGIQNMETEALGTDQDVSELRLQRLGEESEEQNEFYLSGSSKGQQSPVNYQFEKPLQVSANAIKNNKDLTDDQKNQQLIDLVKNNPDKVHSITNPDAGKSANFFSKATLYKMGGTLGDIASFAASQAGMEGAGVPKILHATLPMFLNTQNDSYVEGLNKGVSNPMAYANLHASIVAAAALINPQLGIVKRALGNTGLGKTIAGISEDTWDDIVSENKPVIKKFQNSLGGVLQEGAKMAGVYGAGTSIASDLANKGFFNENISSSDIVDHAVKATKDMMIGSLGLLGLHGVMNFKTVSPEEKARIWEVGDNPKLANQRIDDDVAQGNITGAMGDQKKQVIKNISSLIDKVPTTDAKGKPLTDQAKVNYLYNLIIKDKASKLKSDLPESHGEKLDGVAKDADASNGQILDGTTPKTKVDIPDNQKSAAELVVNDIKSGKVPTPYKNLLTDNDDDNLKLGGQIAKELAGQIHGIDANGNQLEGGGEVNEKNLRDNSGYSGTTLDAVKRDYPKESFKNVEGADNNNPKTIVDGKTAPSSIPQHGNIYTDKNLRTLDYGDFKGQKEDASSDKQIKEDILNDVPVGKSGEKFSDFIKRSIPAVQKVIEDPENNSVVVTHSSVLKAMKVWEQMGRPDVNELQGGKLQEFAQKYNDLKPEKEGQVEVLKGNNGTATQLVRHGETEDNKISDFREDNTELTDRGMSQAKKSGQEIKRMTNGDVTKIVSSDLPRTVHTSNLIMDEVKGTNENNNIHEPDKQSTTVEKTGSGEDEQNNTGIKKAITIEERGKRDLPIVPIKKGVSDFEALQNGKRLVESGEIDPHEIVNKVNNGKGNVGYSLDEADAMQYHMHQLEQQEKEITSDIHAAPKNSFERDNAVGELQQHSDAMDAATMANMYNSNYWGNLGNKMQIEADPSFKPSNIRTIIRENYGGEIPKDVQDKIDGALKERDTAIEELGKAKEQMALTAIKKDAGFAERQTKRQQTKVELKKEREDIIDSIKKAIKKDLGNLNAGIPVPTETLTAIGKLAVNYFKDGVNTIEGLTDKIYQDLKEFNVDKRAIREAISNYSALRDAAQEKQLSKLETKEKSLNSQIESGEPKRPPTKSNIVFNKSADVIRAEQRIALAEKKLRDIKRQSFESQKNWYQKGLMWLGRGFRISILSGTNVLEKLASAASIGGALKRIPEQTIGGIYRNIFKSVAEKAPIEGGLNANSEVKFYKEFFNPKKFADNSWQILRHGESRLTQKMGGSGFEHVPVLYLPTDLHQVIKDPVKRATFEASFRNGMQHAERRGYDINDPLIINSIENAAYKRANYEIFQESNQLSRMFNKWKGRMEAGTAEFGKEPIGKNLGATGKFLADFMIPVSTVPVNIARRVASTSPLGMIRGVGKVANAYRKGIENLAPEEADAVMRQLKQGTLGTALWLTGWFGAKSFGGLWTQFDPDKKRKGSELPSDVMRVDGENIPKPVQHALPLEVLQVAATARHIYDASVKGKENPFEATLKAALGSIGAVAGELPVVETPVHLEEAATTPYGERKLKEDVERRFEPAILKETGVIHSDKKPKKEDN